MRMPNVFVVRESQRSLEIGVGSGRFAEALGIKFGLDSSRELLKMAEKRGIIGILGKAERLPFKDESFEFAYMIFSLCFFEDPLIALKEAYRVLKSDERLILGVIPSESPWAKYYQEKAKKGHPIYAKARFYSSNELNVMLSEASFRIECGYSTLFERPGNEKPITNKEIIKGFRNDGGFFCFRAQRV